MRSRANIDRYATTREEGSLLGKRLEVPLIRKNGEQFIAVASGGGDRGRRGGDLILSFALPPG